ncbi:MAG: SDR family oxidoreductase [Verrucomicrobia bacterium]|nr:MAG: SDR family oxidoreductase [Verrucomicrobiota bacterium]
MSEEMDTPCFSLEGEVAVITGGGTGLGLGMARAMAAAGAKVVVVGRREETLREAVARLGPGAAFVVHDVTQTDEAPALIERAERAVGAPVSILVNNASTHLKKPAVETTPEELEAVLQTHNVAAHALSRAVLPGMMARGHGNILFVASMASYLAIPLIVAYTAAKCATVGLVRALAAECSSRGVRVNAIAPGWIESPMLQKALSGDPARREKILSRILMGSFGSPADIGAAAVFLCSPAARYITGTVLPVDGGAHVGF